MEIYKYNCNTKEWEDIINHNLKSKEKEIAIDNYIKSNGEKVSLQDYFNDWKRDEVFKGYAYKCFGNAENCFERLAKGEIDWDDDLSYCSVKKHHTEDLCEERTDWEDMYSYANGLYWFIESLKSEIAAGKIILAGK